MYWVLLGGSPRGFESSTWSWDGDETWASVDSIGTKALHGPVFPGDVLAYWVTKYLLGE